MSLTLLYDGACGLCVRSVACVRRMDWFGRCAFLDYRTGGARACAFSGATAEELDEALHLVTSSGAVLSGFRAFRRLLWINPLSAPFAPLLYLPGAVRIGSALYAAVSARRHVTRHLT